jgi:hypothetical protein
MLPETRLKTPITVGTAIPISGMKQVNTNTCMMPTEHTQYLASNYDSNTSAGSHLLK